MDAFGVENLRCLSDTELIKLKPLTLLVGENSSGKSTFLRALPLLRQSVESRTRGPILWDGIVDFGSFQEAITDDSEKQEIAFRFQLTLIKSNKSEIMIPRFIFEELLILENLVVSLTLKMSWEKKQGTTHIKECLLSFADEHNLKIELDSNGNVITFLVNSLDILKLENQKYCSTQDGFLVPSVDIKNILYHEKIFIIREIENPLFSEVKKYLHPQTGQEKIQKIVQELIGIGSSTKMLAYIQNLKHGTNTWKNKCKKWTIQNKEFQRLKDMIIASKINMLLSIVDEYIFHCVSRINYIAPVRATTERYYRMQELAVDQIDSQGKNLPMFLQNLTKKEHNDFIKWTENHFGFIPKINSASGHFYMTLKEHGGKKAFNIADTGFGFSQILPIITELWWLISKRQTRLQRRMSNIVSPLFFAIEQPELHLHPRLQAQLADVFLVAIKTARKVNIDLRLIIETHSETIINRLGHHIANGDAKPQDINVVIFEKEYATAQVKVAEYDEEGFITNWPFGFFEPDII